MATSFAPVFTDQALSYAPGQHTFLALATEMLAGLGDGSDTFDSAFLDVTNDFAQHDAASAASDQAFSDFASAAAAWEDSEIDQLAQELGDNAAALTAPENAFQGAVSWLQGNSTLPGSPSTVSIPDFNVSTGIPMPPALPNPPVSGPPSHPAPPGPPPGPPPIFPPVGEPVGNNCYAPGEAPSTVGGCVPQCYDSFSLPGTCGDFGGACITTSYEGSYEPGLPFCP